MSLEDSKNISKVILEQEGRYLVFVRADNGKLDLPGGHCFVGEGFLEGAAREVREECEIEVFDLEEKISYGRKKIFLTNNFSGEIKLDKSENSDFFWADKEYLKNLTIAKCTDVLAIAAANVNRKI